ncbi:PepSY domain-containing protein [Oceanobacillus jeddahense]|uniref:PepSY domain-containing protein n=1 Tax=Oceanobacillus jeddahense TaxID=1462527 RepID=A0ABY5JUW9_9BACI|nr:PepSY domain-containing protein [Oceanobacillus jeddahense]UUI04143.1 PepSY domain-containing protein [Oceanobacillus jeddahense]
MRKKIIWVISALAVFAIIGLTVYQTNATSSNPDLSMEEISEFVSNQYPGQQTEPELSVENGEPVYQMEVTQDQGVYSLKVNGDTGQIIDLTSVERTAENKKEETEKDTEHQEEDNNEDSESDNNSETDEEKTQDNSNDQATENDAVISHEEAMEIARNEFPGEVTDLEMDSDDDILVYEIEIVNGEDEATIEINAYTGNIVSLEIDIDD